MGWKGTLRSINAEINRQSRAAEKAQRAHQKQLEKDQAWEIAQEQSKYFQDITSLHHECRANFDWHSIKGEPEPTPPIDNKPLSQAAEIKLQEYKPGVFDRLFGTEERRKKKLKEKLGRAKIKDQENHEKATQDFKAKQRHWQKQQELADSISNDGKTIIRAFEQHLDIKDLTLGSSVEITISDDLLIDLNLAVLKYENVVPTEEYSLRQSGTLSIKKMAVSKGQELYQDHICSALLRLAQEGFGITAAEHLRVNAYAELLNTQTGHLENQIIVSVFVVKSTLDKMNLERVDPSDSLKNFVHSMNFKKSKGFTPVEKVQAKS